MDSYFAKQLVENIRLMAPEKWGDRPLLYVYASRRISYAPKEDLDNFDYLALIKVERKKMENPELGIFFSSREPETWFLDLSEGLPAGFRDKIVGALENIERSDSKLGAERPDGYQIHLHFCPPKSDPNLPAAAWLVSIAEIRNGDFDRFMYELVTLTECIRPGVQKKAPVCFEKPTLLNFND